jgi:Ca2+-binding EF-hand superfamily protein
MADGKVKPVLRTDLEDVLRREFHLSPVSVPARQRGPARIVCCCLHRESKLRRRAASLVTHPRFDKVVMALIFLNSVALAASDPTTIGGARNDLLWYFEVAFNGCFLVEFCSKVVAFGFWGKAPAYLSDNWNRLDFLCVVLSVPSLLAVVGVELLDFNGAAVRTLRVLKVLRTIRSHEGMRTLVTSLLRAMPLLLNVVYLLGFIFFIFGIMGVQFFAGIMHHRCYQVAVSGPSMGKPVCTASGLGVQEPVAEGGTVRLCDITGGYGRSCPAGYSCHLLDPCDKATLAEAPNSGFTQFDNIGYSFLTIFQSITLEGWSDIMYWTNEATGLGMVSCIYFIMLILVGSMFVINLVLAVVQEAYQKTTITMRTTHAPTMGGQQDRGARVRETDGAAASNRQMAMSMDAALPKHETPAKDEWGVPEEEHISVSADGNIMGSGDLYLHEDGSMGSVEPDATDMVNIGALGVADLMKIQMHSIKYAEKELHQLTLAEMEKLVARFSKEVVATPHRVGGGNGSGKKGKGASWGSARRKPGKQIVVEYLAFLCVAAPTEHCFKALECLRLYLSQAADRCMDADEVFQALDSDGDGTIGTKELEEGIQRLRIPISAEHCADIFHHIDYDGSGAISMVEFFEFASPPASDDRLLEFKLWQKFQPLSYEEQLRPFQNFDRTGTGRITPSQFSAALEQHGFDIQGGMRDKQDTARNIEHLRRNSPIAYKIRKLVMSHRFMYAVMFAIILNTGTLAAERKFPVQSKQEKDTLEVINFLLTMLFNLEMVLKIIGLGCREYSADSYNLFDALIVVVSDVELVLQSAYANSSSGMNVSVLRTLRLLRVFRVFKLAKSWYNLRKLIETILKSWMGLATFSCILALLVTIFALFGMQTLGGNLFTDDPYNLGAPTYANFDNFMQAVLAVFQVLTGEDWNAVLYDAMRWDKVFGAIFLSSMFFIGNYIMLSLFIAILLQNFQDAEGEANQTFIRQLGKKSDIAVFLKKLGKATGKLLRCCLLMPLREAAMEEEAIAVRRRRLARARGTERSLWEGRRRREGKRQAREAARAGRSLFSTATKQMEVRLAKVQEEALAELAKVRQKAQADAAQEIAMVQFFNDKSGSLGMPVESAREVPTLTAEGQEESLKETHRFANHMQAVVTTDHVRSGFRTLYNCFTAETLVGAIQVYGYASNQDEARMLGQSLLDLGRIVLAAAPLANPTSELPPVFLFDGTLYNFLSKQKTSVVEGAREYDPKGQRKAVEGERLRDTKRKILAGSSLFCLTEGNAVRHRIVDLLLNPWWERFINTCILVSCVTLCFPGTPDTLSPLWTIDLVISIIFIGEMLFKVTAMGFIFSRYAYLHDGWNLLDFFIVVISIINLSLSGSSLKAFKSIRAMRALRPLRLVSRMPGMRMVVNALFKALPSISNVFIVVVLFFLIFGIVAVQMFGGALYYCADTPAAKWTVDKANCTSWVTPPANFDNIGIAMLTLLEVCTGEMWPAIMHTTMNINTEGSHPVRQNHVENGIFFVIFIVICSFFIMSLFLGIMIFKFGEIKEEENGSLFLTTEQRVWVETQKVMFRTKPEFKALSPKTRAANALAHSGGKAGAGCLARATLPLRSFCYHIVITQMFEMFIMAVIVANIIFMSMRHYNESATFTDVAQVLNRALLGIYVVEAALKLLGLGVRQYYRSAWNSFDFFIVVGSLVGEATGGKVNPAILRVFRIARVIRLVRVSRGLRKLFATLILSLTSLINVGSLLLLVYFVYAVMGMNLFGQHSSKDDEFINEHANFANVGTGMITLFRCSTGESWNGLMHDLQAEQPFMARLFFVTFMVFASMMMLNLFIAVILENFGDMMREYNDGVSPDHIDAFAREWGKLAEAGAPFLPSFTVVKLLQELPPPLGMKGLNITEPKRIIKFIRRKQLKRDANEESVRYGMVSYIDMLHSLCASSVAEHQRNLDNPKLQRDFDQQLQGVMHENIGKLGQIDCKTELFDLTDEFNAATGVQVNLGPLALPNPAGPPLTRFAPPPSIPPIAPRARMAGQQQCLWRSKKEREKMLDQLTREGRLTPGLCKFFGHTPNTKSAAGWI